MIVSINQPAYLPWLGYFHRIAASDEHVILDQVQFEKNSFVNRNRVRTADGSCWLTVPVRTAGRFRDLPIAEVEIDERSDWATKHWRTLQQSYGKAPYFAKHAPFFAEVYATPWRRLLDLNEAITRYLLDALGVATPRRFASSIPELGRKEELPLSICRALGATTYLSGTLGRQYLREELFREAGIALVYQDYQHPVYDQRRPGFESGLAAVDLLFHHGPDSLRILVEQQPSVP